MNSDQNDPLKTFLDRYDVQPPEPSPNEFLRISEKIKQVPSWDWRFLRFAVPSAAVFALVLSIAIFKPFSQPEVSEDEVVEFLFQSYQLTEEAQDEVEEAFLQIARLQ